VDRLPVIGAARRAAGAASAEAAILAAEAPEETGKLSFEFGVLSSR
jgi:hypothetical protein